MDLSVTLCALIAGCLCFVIYVGSAVVTLFDGKWRHQTVSDLTSAAKSVAAPMATAADYTKLLEAASKLTDSLSKAGPTLVSLIGAILFLLIAAVSNGALKNAPPPTPSAPAGTAGTTTR